MKHVHLEHTEAMYKYLYFIPISIDSPPRHVTEKVAALTNTPG